MNLLEGLSIFIFVLSAFELMCINLDEFLHRKEEEFLIQKDEYRHLVRTEDEKNFSNELRIRLSIISSTLMIVSLLSLYFL